MINNTHTGAAKYTEPGVAVGCKEFAIFFRHFLDHFGANNNSLNEDGDNLFYRLAPDMGQLSLALAIIVRNIGLMADG